MQIIHCFTYLIQNPLFMFFLQNSFPYESEKIDVHMFENQVNIDVIICSDYLLHFYDIRVFQFHEKHDFTISSLSIGRIIKSVKIFLQSFYFFVFIIDNLPHMTIGSTTYFLEDLKLAENMRFQVLSHILFG